MTSVGLQVLETNPVSPYQSREVEMLKHFAEVREHEKEVLQKVTEDRSNFSKITKDNISQKMEAYKENRVAQRAVLNEKFKARVSPPVPATSRMFPTDSRAVTTCCFLLATGQEAGRSKEEKHSVNSN